MQKCGDKMNNENIIELIFDLCKYNPNTSIEYELDKPIIAEKFSYKMHKKFNHEILIKFPSESNEIIKFIKILDKYIINNNFDYIEHFGKEIMKKYDTLIIWWK